MCSVLRLCDSYDEDYQVDMASMIKVDKEATRAAKFHDLRSYIATWLHPNTTHACRYLYGEDVQDQRYHVFEVDQGKCFNCGAWYGPRSGELHHRQGGLGRQRCWCLENLAWSCPKCHRAQHVQTRWYEKKD